MKELNKEGFSLVEIIIAIAISSIVMLSVIALLGYGSHNMKLTQAKVALQDQAKDATNHISSYVTEASNIDWDDTDKMLTIERDTIDNESQKESIVGSTEKFFYWYKDKALYFAREAEVSDPAALAAAELKNHLLAENVDDFECTVNENADTGNKMLHILIDMSDDISEFSCTKDVYMRNQ
ncbi:MAG: prepilin-type N-terminal cleavage/methylation domain-containing protein [Lachnospiraceae bacterium]|nr:prepilin-type N-terminal cleavage/methylation domain-containing protein [Lachnospiraceae bacterium]